MTGGRPAKMEYECDLTYRTKAGRGREASFSFECQDDEAAVDTAIYEATKKREYNLAVENPHVVHYSVYRVAGRFFNRFSSGYA